jgi:hypothetical protein
MASSLDQRTAGHARSLHGPPRRRRAAIMSAKMEHLNISLLRKML